jgi:putative oxidoreductase
MELGLFILRVVVGALLAGHGAQKLFGYFGGHGLEGTAAFFEQIGLRPGLTHATAAGLMELTAGILLIFGLLTPLAAVMVTAVMVAAILTVHGENGPWVTENGFEYNLVLVAVAFALAAVGPGDWSLDAAMGLDIAGAAWAVIAAAAGACGGYAAVLMGRRAPQHSQQTGTMGHAH